MAKKNWGKWEYKFDKAYPREYESIGGGSGECDLMNVRYVLGEEFTESERKGARTLICIGLNPSSAVPMNLDFTVGRVRKYALESKKYRAWYMLNLYPQRATDSDDLDENALSKIAERNSQYIKELLDTLGKDNCDIWCAWGTAISKRDYLGNVCVKEIGELLNDCKLYAYTKNDIPTDIEFYPGHPQVMPKEVELLPIELTAKGLVKKKLKNR